MPRRTKPIPVPLRIEGLSGDIVETFHDEFTGEAQERVLPMSAAKAIVPESKAKVGAKMLKALGLWRRM